ncbi:MAG: hypothetical protein AAGF47_03745 [Planctomycetota bacterium]
MTAHALKAHGSKTHGSESVGLMSAVVLVCVAMIGCAASPSARYAQAVAGYRIALSGIATAAEAGLLDQDETDTIEAVRVPVKLTLDRVGGSLRSGEAVPPTDLEQLADLVRALETTLRAAETDAAESRTEASP